MKVEGKEKMENKNENVYNNKTYSRKTKWILIFTKNPENDDTSLPNQDNIFFFLT